MNTLNMSAVHSSVTSYCRNKNSSFTLDEACSWLRAIVKCVSNDVDRRAGNSSVKTSLLSRLQFLTVTAWECTGWAKKVSLTRFYKVVQLHKPC